MMQGLVLMAVGMGTVFAFLGLLVTLLHASAAFFRSWPEDAQPTRAPAAKPPQSGELELIAIALAAIERSRT
jgi:sodium pump decarboxylase gamma subunit